MSLSYLERKLTLGLRSDIHLLEMEETFWRGLTEAAGVRILKQDRGTGLRAFLLAESSLLAWDQRMILMTCGQGDLPGVVPWIQARLGNDAVTASILESPELRTELRLSQRSSGPLETLASAAPTQKNILWEFEGQVLSERLKGLLPRNAEIFQEHEFQPAGYSCNACTGESFLTLHFSPGSQASCLSFESRGFDAAHGDIMKAATEELRPHRIFHPLISKHEGHGV